MINYLSEKGNVRKGLCEEPDFRRIYGFLSEYSADLFLFSYVTGMRSGEVKSLKWAFVNKDVIELQPEKSKEGEPRLIPIEGKDLAGILERRKIVRQVKTPDGGTMIADLIFHRNGKPIVDPRKSWKTACKKAGLPGLIPHDLRRCAAKSRRGRCPARRSDVHHRSQDRIDVQALQHRQPQTAAQWVGAGAGIS